ncbi:MAG TPA: polysaccharide deacetylase family protein, partial [Polyangia bacterium]|nr:polysaccharide deacetylase family protein [Polyangia bacterium]
GNAGGNGGSTGGAGGAVGGAGGGNPVPNPLPDVPFGKPVGTIPTAPTQCMAAADAGAFTYQRIATWRDDAKSAYAMIHDDVCGENIRGVDKYAIPVLAMRNVTAGLGPFVQVCQSQNLWAMIKDAEDKGNEIINHSYTHPNITTVNAPMEVAMSKKFFDTQIKNPISFFIFPYDFWTPDTVKAVSDAGHLGARAGVRDAFDGFTNPPINPAVAPTDPAMQGNDLSLVFDVWPRAYSKYALYPAKDLLNIHVFNAIDKGGFALREFHSITAKDEPPKDDSEGFGPVPLRTYEAHLDFLVNAWKSNQVWTSTPTRIIKYRHARTACKATVAAGAITFTASPECTKYATPISVIVKSAKDVPGLKAMQGANPVFVRKLGNALFSVTADPTAGKVDLSGCATPVPSIENVPLPARPMPANSVCDLEKVVGTGMEGRMDDLERAAEFLQTLPNPRQADGRTGSWSNYPGNALIELKSDLGNRMLRFHGSNLNAWAGVTLAFLGGNGAGACYDASAYKGIKFRIRGNVTTPDMFNGTVFVSLVTAETQTQKYGGDLKGEGGHFNKQIKITADWQTVMIPWTDLAKPTWGDTANLTQPALGKMQAIDWGVSNTASTFDYDLDDIELF